jgi:hypothetical protein
MRQLTWIPTGWMGFTMNRFKTIEGNQGRRDGNMFGTILKLALTGNRSCRRRWGLVLTFSATVLSLSFSQLAQADVPTPIIFSILSPSPILDRMSPPQTGFDAVKPRIDAITQRMVVHRLQQLTTKPDGSFNAPYAKKLGFMLPAHDAEALLQKAQLSFPIPLFTIGLKRLQQLDSSFSSLTMQTSPLQLLANEDNWLFTPPSFSSLTPQLFLYAITIDNTVHSSVRVRVAFSLASPTPHNLIFHTERLGSGALIKLIDTHRRDPITRRIREEYFFVSVPALNRYYLGRLHNHNFLITAITDDLPVGLLEGQEGDARAVFLKLKIEALTINADDPNSPPR